jgi:apolipoprotein N-acyltransferase
VICSWSALVWWGSLLFIGPGHGLYLVLAGLCLRRLSPRYPMVLAVPAAYVGLETLRAVIEPPLGLPWMRLGTNAHAVEWFAGSARVWGVGGLSFVTAATSGACVDLALAWRDRSPRARLRAGLVACGPLALAALLGVVLAAPESRPGPRVLLVQPAFPQERKMEPAERSVLFLETYELTRQSLRSLENASELPDLVAWGETMLHMPVIDRALVGAVRAGARADPWAGLEPENPGDPTLLEILHRWLAIERDWVDAGLFGAGEGVGILPQGTAFVSGAEYLTSRDGRVRRQNTVVLWTGPEQRLAPVAKRHLVPGAESLLGLERFRIVRDSLFALANYVPDLLGETGDSRLSFVDRAGRRWTFAASICFDNAFDDPYTRPVRAGSVDFHLVLSNEAWFKDSQEFDQMLAFSRLIAISTGRSVVRATNSGVSAVFDPSGREVARLERAGRDRGVSGTLTAVVPVPVRAADVPPFARLRPLWLGLWLVLPLALLALGGWRGNPVEEEG